MTKYHQVPPYTDPEPPSTNQQRPTLTQYHQVPTNTVLYRPSTTKYQTVLSYTFEYGKSFLSYFQENLEP